MVPLMTQLKMETQLFICAVFMVIFLVYRLDIFTVNFIFLSFHDITSLIFLFMNKLLLDRGASPEIKDEEGAIPLHDACAGG